MFVSAAVYVWFGGWWFGIGLVGLLFVHEMGHVLEAKRQGLPVSAPLFIPFLGAMITLKEMPTDAWSEAKLALAGPLLGSAGAAASGRRPARLELPEGDRLPRLLHQPLQPAAGRAARRRPDRGAIHPALWLIGFLGLLGLVVWAPNPILILILLFAAMSSGSAGRRVTTPRCRRTTGSSRSAAHRRCPVLRPRVLLVLGMPADTPRPRYLR